MQPRTYSASSAKHSHITGQPEQPWCPCEHKQETGAVPSRIICFWDSPSTAPTLIIAGRPEGADGNVTTESRIDHWAIMGLMLVPPRAREPVVIRDAPLVAKRDPAFFADLRRTPR